MRVGEEGRGIATILDMVMLTRLDCMLGSAAEMRMALAQAVHHARHRSAFGKRLVDQPLMRNVLADLAIESEAALALSMRVARAVDAAPRDPREAALRAHRHGDRQVLDLQARTGLRQRSAGMPRRRRLRRGVAPAAPVSPGAAEFDLGRQRQHPVPRRVARVAARTGERRGVLRRTRRRRRHQRALDAAIARLRTMRDARRTKPPRACWSNAWRWRCRRRSCCVRMRRLRPLFCESRLDAEHGLAFGTLPVDDAMFASILSSARCISRRRTRGRARLPACGASHAHSAGHPASIGGPTLRTTRS